MSFVTRLDDCPPDLPTPTPDLEAPISNDWFPDIDPAAIRAGHRIRDAVTAARLREALISAIITVGNDLAAWATERQASGATSLEQVPSPTIDGETRLVRLYRRAVALYAKAEITERYRDIDIAGAGERRAEDLDPSISELRRDAAHAVRDLLGRTRTTVELI